ncbi:MAG: hypothetical protein SO206_00800 [Bacilli bacterium]|nr:hypothetical protein [Bacilli bacterium]MDY5669784.1 hypothetical protein [Bacilli bacterium]
MKNKLFKHHKSKRFLKFKRFGVFCLLVLAFAISIALPVTIGFALASF